MSRRRLLYTVALGGGTPPATYIAYGEELICCRTSPTLPTTISEGLLRLNATLQNSEGASYTYYSRVFEYIIISSTQSKVGDLYNKTLENSDGSFITTATVQNVTSDAYCYLSYEYKEISQATEFSFTGTLGSTTTSQEINYISYWSLSTRHTYNELYDITANRHQKMIEIHFALESGGTKKTVSKNHYVGADDETGTVYWGSSTRRTTASVILKRNGTLQLKLVCGRQASANQTVKLTITSVSIY